MKLRKKLILIIFDSFMLKKNVKNLFLVLQWTTKFNELYMAFWLNEKSLFIIKTKIEKNNFSIFEFFFVYLNAYLY